MKQYFISSPFILSGMLVLKGDSFFGEKIGNNIFMYNPKTRKKVGYVSEIKLLEHCEDEQ